jgi:hypothetical protein
MGSVCLQANSNALITQFSGHFVFASLNTVNWQTTAYNFTSAQLYKNDTQTIMGALGIYFNGSVPGPIWNITFG